MQFKSGILLQSILFKMAQMDTVWGLKEYKRKGGDPSLVGSSVLSGFVGLVVPVQEILFCSEKKTNFLTVHYFNPVSPSPSKLGRQSC